MKKQSKIVILILLVTQLGFSFGNETTFSKQKSIQKAYYVNADAILEIDNSYGNISVSTWDENKIELDILIKVSGDNENWVNQRLRDIDVNINALKSKVAANTIITNSNSYNNGNNNSFEINYILKIPKNGSVNLINKYGDIFTTDLLANVNVACKYGKIILGKLSGKENNIEIAYCPNSTINEINIGSVIAKYSGLKINEAGKLNLISDYTDVTVNEIQNLNYTSKYGILKFQKANSINGIGNYLTIKIGELLGNLNLDTKYSTINIGSINSKNIIINGSYTNVTIGFTTNYAFDFDISGKYINFDPTNDLEIYNSEDSKNAKQYNGYFRKKGENKITIASNYGNVSLSKK